MPFGQFANEGRAHQAFNPSKMNKAMSFDIEIKVKVGGGATIVDRVTEQVITPNFQLQNDNVNKTMVTTETSHAASQIECTLAFIRNARLTSTDFKVSKRGLAIQSYTFAAQYLNEDTFLADMSGVGQQFM
jgi:hypothetical protein